jgi:cell wall-associated NlpC family hydrolase
MNKVRYLLVFAILLPLANCASMGPAQAATQQTAQPAVQPSSQQASQAAAQPATRPAQPAAKPGQQSASQAAASPAETTAPVETATPVETTTPAETPRHSSLVSAEALGLYRSTEEQQEAPSDDETAVIASAKTLIGKPPNAKVTVNGKGFTLDCIGTVNAIFYGVSMDVTKDSPLYTGDGVNRLYMTLKERNALHTDKYPRPGDVIIWDNTWDTRANGDRIHSPRTHAGVVLAVDDDGTIHYVHENLYKGIMVETMNLLRPTVARDEQGKQINSGMAISSKVGAPLPPHTLSGDVFDCFGDVLGSKDYFYVDLGQ